MSLVQRANHHTQQTERYHGLTSILLSDELSKARMAFMYLERKSLYLSLVDCIQVDLSGTLKLCAFCYCRKTQ